MSESTLEALVTECPKCDTSFRVTEAQLQVAGGRVRCGACLHVFEGTNHLRPAEMEDEIDDEIEDDIADEIDELAEAAANTNGDSVQSELDNLLEQFYSNQEVDISEDILDYDAAAEYLGVKNKPAKTGEVLIDDHTDLDALLGDEEEAKPTVSLAELELLPKESETTADEEAEEVEEVEVEEAKEILAGIAKSFAGGDSTETAETEELEIDLEALPDFDLEPLDKAEDAWALEDSDDDLAPDVPENVQEMEIVELPAGAAIDPEEGVDEDIDDGSPDELDELDEIEKLISAERSALKVPLAQRLAENDKKQRLAQRRPAIQPKTQKEHAAKTKLVEAEKSEQLPKKPIAESDVLEVVALDSLEMGADDLFPKEKPGWLWPLIAVVGLAGLIFQVFWMQFDSWTSEPGWRRDVYTSVCPTIGCEVPALVNLSAITSKNLVVRTHPDQANMLLVDAVIVNEADFPQAFPGLELRFTSMRRESVATVEFEPAEYLAGELQGATMMESRLPIRISIPVPDPGPEAVNYTMKFR